MSKEILQHTVAECLHKTDQAIKKTVKRINEKIQICIKHDNSIHNKMSDYDQYQLLITENSPEAQQFWEEKKLGISLERKTNKQKEISDEMLKLKTLKDCQVHLENYQNHLDEYLSKIDQEFTIEGIKFIKADSCLKKWRIPNSKWKTFQDVFTPFDLRINPVNEPLNKSAENYDSLPLSACFVDINRISKSFMNKLLNYNSRTSNSKCQIIDHKINNTNKIVEIFENLKPLTQPNAEHASKHKNYRILIVQNHPQANGHILYTAYKDDNEDFSGCREPKDKIIYIYNSIYSAKRKTAHQFENYEEEGEIMQQLRLKIKKINNMLGTIHKNDPPEKKQITREKAKNMIMECVDLIGKTKNIYKTAAKKQLSSSTEMQDSKQRKNHPAIMARLTNAEKQPLARGDEITRKSGYAKIDHEMLKQYIDYAVSVFKDNYSQYKDIYELLIKQNKQTNDPEVQIALEMLRKNQANLNALNINPFNHYANLFSLINNKLNDHILDANREKIMDILKKGYILYKIFDLHHQTEIIINSITETHLKIDPEIIIKELKTLSDEFYDIPSKLMPPTFMELFQLIHEVIFQIHNLINFKHQNPFEEKNHIGIMGAIVELLKSIKYNDVIKNISSD